ncbi:MAG: TonB-dependent receptor [Niveispirillum sp.]|nr:TonB-dependent receptor [Niveispirillum sp.]
MKQSVYSARSIRGLLMAGAAVSAVAMTAAPAMAQEIEEIVVTGSRIASPNLVATSPITVVGQDEIKYQGTTRVEDLVNSLPQAFASQSSQVSNGSTGTATIDLRNLGASRTLVLVDGRRLPPGSPGSGGSAPDINQIPGALIERVEVATGGASAVYGSDAVAGVVNFIMKDDFEGVAFDFQYSFYQHDNNNGVADVVRARNFPLPDDSVTDGFTRDSTVVMGASTEDGKGNVTLYAGYRKIDAILQSERDYSACTVAAGAGVWTCSGSGTTAPTRILATAIGGGTAPSDSQVRADGSVSRYTAATGAYNFGPINYYQRPDERYTLGAFGKYEINENVTAYTQLMFMDNQTVAQIAPSGLFGVSANIRCDNPMLTATQRTQYCGSLAGTSNTVGMTLFRRNVEGGGRQSDLQHTSWRMVGGFKGDVGGWDYDVAGQYARVNFAQTYYNDFSISRGTQALDAVRNAAGQIVCRDESNGCVPYNIFTPGGVTQGALDFLQTPGFQRGYTEQKLASANISKDLGDYGLTIPTASTGIAIALGTEYREEFLSRTVDTAFATGDLAGQGGPTLGVAGGFDVTELYGELRVPLVEDAPFVKQLTLDLGYRYSDYSNFGGTDTYKVAGDWAPIDDFRIRGSYNRAVRAPNVQELFTPQGLGLFNMDEDPCAGATPTFTLAQCANMGVTAAQYGRIVENTAGQYNSLDGGNPNLQPETSDTYSIGFVATPAAIEGLSLTVDYFKIKIKDVISTVPSDLAVNRCGTTGNAAFCSLITRDPSNGSLWIGTVANVLATNVNIASLSTSGIDLDLAYRFDLEDAGLADAGSLSFSLVGTWMDTAKSEPLPGEGEYDCVGLHGATCGVPTPEWRHRLRTTWATPWDANLSLSWRYIDSVKAQATSSNPLLSAAFNPLNEKLKAMNYIDLAATYSPIENLSFSAGVNNIFDRDPPLSSALASVTGNGNTYPGVYDSMGRYVFMGAQVKF